MRSALCLLCLLLTLTARAAELPSLRLSLNAARTKLSVQLTAEGWLKAPANEVARQALQEAFGAAPENLRVYPLQEWDDEEYTDEDESEGAKPTKPVKPPKVTGFALVAQLPVSRSLLEVRGTLDPRPLQALFIERKPDPLSVSISLNNANAGHVLCQGLSEKAPLSLPRSRRTPFRQFSGELAARAAPLTFAVGWDTADLARVLGPPFLLFLVPVIATLIFRRRAQIALETLSADDARRAVATGYLRLLNHGTLLFSPIWLGMSIALRPEQVFGWFLGPPSPEFAFVRGMGSVAFPLFLVQLTCALISHPVIRRLQKNETTFRDVFAETGGQYLIQYVPALCFFLALGALFGGSFLFLLRLASQAPELRAALWRDPGLHRAIGWLVAGFVARFLLPALVGARGITTVALQSGPLFEGVQALARQMGVPVRQVLYLQTGKALVANAFAAHGNIVALTDQLVASLTRRETNAVIAHELGHLKQKHATILGWLNSPLVLIGLMIFLVPRLPDSATLAWLYVPLLILGQTFLQLAFSRGWERTADKLAAQLTGDPLALLTGLAKLARINGSPESWTRWDESLLTHPSTQRRAENLIRANLITREDAERVFAPQATPDEDYYPAPPPSHTFVFSDQWRLRRNLRGILGILILCAAVPLIVAAILERVHLAQPLLVAVLGTAAAVALYPLLFVFLGISKDEIAKLRQSLIAQGKLTSDDTAHFVGMTPGILPRSLASGGNWDYGFLVLREGTLHFVGERREFALTGAALSEVSLTWRAAAVRAVSAVVLRWGQGEHAACRLQSYPLSTTPALMDHLKSWKAQTNPSPEPESLPFFATLEGRTPRQMGTARAILPNFWVLGLMITGIWAFSGVARGQLLPILTPVCFIMGVEWLKNARFPEKQLLD
ncbi:MAG: M48 family metalloprotease [Armatimonadetes bacterium]|nr:M48 family metalloprotease [Armatimonadota bacterium]